MEVQLINERKKMMLELFSDEQYKPMKIKELAMLLNIEKKDRDELKEVLDSLLEEGKISLSKRGKYALPERYSYTGIYSGNARGFGFVEVESLPEDVFISADDSAGAFHGDMVRIVITGKKPGRRMEGRVTEVLKHSVEEVVGTLDMTNHYGFVIPDNAKLNKDIFIPKENLGQAKNGQKVVCRITRYGSERHNAEGVITQVLGYPGEAGVDILSVAMSFGLPMGFPEDVLAEARTMPQEVVAEEGNINRSDYTHILTVTIDGEDAKDLDDAISLEKSDSGYKLYVHIADVTHYVKEGSPLDKEAVNRGTSVYLIEKVIPMLPKELSNGICSLNAGVRRLALTCSMDIDNDGKVIGHKISESIILVDKRCTYTEVNDVLSGNESGQVPDELKTFYHLMHELSVKLREKRRQRGAIDFDFPECKIILDEQGKPVEIKPYDRNAATMLIEDFMLLANETIAEDFYWQEIPFAYRVHEKPETDKIKTLSQFVKNFGFRLKFQGDDIHPKELQKLLEGIGGSPQEALISRITLRSMKRAVYQPDCEGHFGLAAKYYCHFTSPIRRYPDLQIHRIIKESLHGGLAAKRKEHYETILPGVCAISSKMERLAEEAEREVVKIKKCEYMSRFLGEEFAGVISGITNYGIYVELENTVEGMIRLSDLKDDYYSYNEDLMELTGEAGNKRYTLGQTIRVTVSNVDKLAHTIDFLPAE